MRKKDPQRAFSSWPLGRTQIREKRTPDCEANLLAIPALQAQPQGSEPPISVLAAGALAASSHRAAHLETRGGDDGDCPCSRRCRHAGRAAVVRRIAPADLLQALRCGLDDFAAMPSHAVFLCIIYPLLGIMLVSLTFGYTMLPLLFPLAAGFALIGPIAAIGLYEFSRRREAGTGYRFDSCPRRAAFALARRHHRARHSADGDLPGLACGRRRRSMWPISATPHRLPSASSSTTFCSRRRAGASSLSAPASDSCLPALVLTISVVSFPLLLDRDVGAAVALLTSVRAVAANPVTMALWGLIVTALLVVGSLPFFLGLTVVMPVLGHSTWHLYRRVVEPDPAVASGFPAGAHEPSLRGGFPGRAVHAAR